MKIGLSKSEKDWVLFTHPGNKFIEISGAGAANVNGVYWEIGKADSGVLYQNAYDYTISRRKVGIPSRILCFLPYFMKFIACEVFDVYF